MASFVSFGEIIYKGIVTFYRDFKIAFTKTDRMSSDLFKYVLCKYIVAPSA